MKFLAETFISRHKKNFKEKKIGNKIFYTTVEESFIKNSAFLREF